MKQIYFILLMLAALSTSAQIPGKVTGEDGLGLEGATVASKTQKTVTGPQGRFTLSSAGQIKVSYIGYRDTILQMSSGITIQLHRPSSILQEVTVSTGYQELPKERATGSFVQVDKALVDRSVSTSVIDRLRDVVPGLHFDAGLETFKIQGQNTLFSNADPLIVVDGFPYNSPVTDINPNDVESMTVLKDAAAASIWGTKAGNGVVVITTKKGKFSSAPVVSFSTSVNVAARPDLFYLPAMSSADYISIERKLFSQGYYTATEASPYGLPLTPSVELMIAARDGKISAASLNSQLAALGMQDVRKDESKYLYRPSVDQQYAASLSGGSAASSYFISAGFDKNLDNLAGNGLDRITLKANNTWTFLDRKLELTTGLNLTQANTAANNPGRITWNQGQQIYPYAQLNGTLTHDYRQSLIAAAQQAGLENWSYNPLQELQLADNTVKVNEYRVNTGLSYRLPYGFKVSLLYQYDYNVTANRNFMDADSYYARNLYDQFAQPDGFGGFTFPVPAGGILDLGNSVSENHDLRAQLDYNHVIGKGELTAIAGYEIQSLRVKGDTYRLYGYDPEHAISVPVDGATEFSYYNNPNIGTPVPMNQGSADATDHSLSYYANAAYTWDGRLTLSGSGRLDRSNLFGVDANQKGVPLWSAGLGWNLSREGFYHVDALPELKLRATFGYNGNINKSLSAYTTALYQAGSSQVSLLPFASITNPPNPNLRWERDRNINLGLDFGTKGGRVTGTLDVFWKQGIDLIGSTSYAPSTGIIVFTGNDAGTSGHGFDLNIESHNLRGKLSWVTDWFVSYVTNIVNSYAQQSTVTAYLQSGAAGNYALQGKPLFAVYSYKWAGLDPATGDPQGYMNGAASKNYTAMAAAATPQNLVYNGPSKPPVFGSLRNTFAYGNWGLSVNISYEFGFYFRKNSVRYGVDNGLTQQSGDYALRWQKPGDEANTNVPSAPSAPNAQRDDFYTYSSALVAKGDNIRLRDARLSYRFHGAEVYVYAANLGLIWKANKFGQDPDYPNNFPAPVTVAGGLRFTY